ncbi:MAG: molybdopterin-synthase adenylyltransferase MoeB [Nannocystaceae bacterium]
MERLDQRLDAARARVREVSVGALIEGRTHGASVATILDVREPHEVDAGAIPGCVAIPRGLLELQMRTSFPDLGRPLVVVCEAGTRSLLAADTLVSLGYREVCSLVGGMAAWREAGGSVVERTTLRPDQRRRYQRHLSLPEVGEEGQRRLLTARVLCVGAGGLGSPCALYLAAAGVGTLGVADPDHVEASNLQRQVLHPTERVGMAKVASAELTLRGLNPDVDVVTHHALITEGNIDEIASGYEVIVDGSDNFETRDVVNRYAVRHGVPVVHASIHRFEGQVTSFLPGGPCYRCLFPKTPSPEAAPSCAEAGVLGVLPGILGTIQATEVIKILLGIGAPLGGRLLVFDALELSFSTLSYARAESCAACGSSQ